MREVRGDEALILIVGNKKDIEDERAVQANVATEEFKKLGLPFMEVSAKTGANVKEFFKDLAFMAAGGKKAKDETATSKSQSTTVTAPAPPVQADNKVNLKKSTHEEKKKDKKGCC